MTNCFVIIKSQKIWLHRLFFIFSNILKLIPVDLTYNNFLTECTTQYSCMFCASLSSKVHEVFSIAGCVGLSIYRVNLPRVEVTM